MLFVSVVFFTLHVKLLSIGLSNLNSAAIRLLMFESRDGTGALAPSRREVAEAVTASVAR